MAKDDITVHVSTPAGAFRGAFPKTTKIADVIQEVVKAKGLDPNDDLKLYSGDQLLALERPLVSFQFGAEVKLSLLATGSGV